MRWRDDISKVSSDDEIDIVRKLDKANLLLLSGFENLNKDLNRGFNNLTTIMLEQNTRMDEHNTRLEAHNTRLEAILEKLIDK